MSSYKAANQASDHKRVPNDIAENPIIIGHEFAGEIVEGNIDLEADPSLVNTDPYGAGWIFKVRLKDAAAVDTLMDASAYKGLIG